MTDVKSNWWAETERDPIHLAAADWLVRLHNPEVALEETLAWQAWIKEDSRHAQAFARVEAVSQLMPRVHIARELTPRDLARDSYDASIPLKEWQAPPQRFRAFGIAASIALLGCGLSLGLYFGTSALSNSKPAYVVQTKVGENKAVSLPDGSRIVLGGATQISVSLSERMRDIQLSKGEALFTVMKDPSRPFKVRAGDATVMALGTEFNVRRAHDRAIVSVTEGSVLVEPANRLLPVALLREFKPKLRPVRLSAGQQTTAGSAGIENAAKIEDPAVPTSWRSGQLVFRLQPLRYVVEDVNRYAPKPIHLGDEELGTLVITGMVTRENINGWIASLERAFALHAVEEADRIVLLPPPPR
jgi:transmembrane sensor